MESANFHHHRQQQDHHQLVDSSFSWSSNPVSINGTTNNINSRNLDTNCTDSMVQEYLRFPYNGTIGYPPLENYVTHELQRLARIKDEFSVADQSYHPKFLDLLNCSPTSSMEDLHSTYMKNNDHHQMSYSNNNNNNNQEDFQMIINARNSWSNGTFSQIFPTTSILSMNQSTSSASSSAISSISSSSFDMNCLPALDLIGSPRLFDGHFSHHPSLNALNIIGGRSNYGFDHRMHQSNHRPAVCPNKAVSNTGSTYQSTKKRQAAASKYMDAKATRTIPLIKKPKSEPRSSVAPPFQVRKEKLGDRIAAIQQLVSPFGKTDTASVLMEAIGYIKFQQTQVQTLTVPYMKSTNKIGGLSSERGQMEVGNPAGKRDLRSRGLCLVPLSCLSYVTDGCEGIWPDQLN